MRLAIALTLILIIPTAALAWLAAETAYPANPSVQSDALFVGGPGVARYHHASGGVVWSALQEELLGDPLVIGSLLVIGGNRTLFVLDSGTGRLLWRHRFRDQFFDPVLAHGNIIVTSRSGKVSAFSRQSGDLLWERRPVQSWLYPPAVDGELLVTGGQDRVVVALNATTGDSIWQREMDQELVYGPLATGSGGVVVTTFSGNIFMLQSDDGSELWRTTFDTPSLFPAIVNRKLLFSEWDGTLHALDPDTGQAIWKQTLPSRLVAPVSGGSGSYLLATIDGGEVFLLDSDTGATLKHFRIGADTIGSALFAGNRIVVFVRGRNNSGPVPVYLEVFPELKYLNEERLL